MRHTAAPVAFACIATLMMGCQSGSNPATPAATNTPATPPSLSLDTDQVPVGIVDLRLDLTTMESTLTPVRLGSAVGDIYSELGLAPGFTELFGNHFRVEAMRLAGPGTVEVDMAIEHPFSASIRPDLAIFNLKCYVVTDGATTLTTGGETFAPGILANADGYGDMWATTADTLPAFTTASIQPYVILHEDPTAGIFDFQNPAGYNVFFPGQSSVDTLSLNIGSGSTFQARLYLTADYGQSAVRATRQTPAYELPRFAGNAPWKVGITTLANNLVPGDTGSSAEFRVDIWDWKHGLGLNSDIVDARLFIPDVMTVPQSLLLTGSGSELDPLTGQTLILNTQGAPIGTYWATVEVLDSGTGTGLKEDLSTPISLDEYRTWQVERVELITPAVPPTASFAILNCNPAAIRQGGSASLDGSGSTPGDNPITTYDWDFDYDGSTFDVDGSGITIGRPCPATGTFTIALRVTDSALNSDIETAQITVVPSAPGWLTPVRLTNDTFTQQFDAEGDDPLTVAPDGTVHLVYLATSGSAKRYEHIELDPCPGGSWSTPELIFDPGTGISSLMPASTIDANGDLNVVFLSSGNLWRHMVKSGGSWSAPVNVTGAPPASGTWRTAAKLSTNVDGTLGFLGVVHPAFSTFCPGVPAPPSPLLVYEFDGASWDAGTQAGAADCCFTISGSCGSTTFVNETADLVSLASGDWLVVWEDLVNPYISANTSSAGQVGWARQTAGVWGPEGNLYPVGGSADQCRLARDPSGLIWLGFRRSGGEVNVAQYDGSSWSAATTQVLAQVSYPRLFLTIDALGHGVLGSSVDAAGIELRLKAFSDLDSLATIAAAPHDQPQPNQIWTRGYCQAIARPDGTLAATWRSGQWGTGAASEMEGNVWE